MRSIYIVCILVLFGASLKAEEEHVQTFFEAYPKHYQDICIGDKVYPVGENICDQRFELIRPFLDSFDKPFSVLDLGACEGYFSFRIAQEYPAFCHMIEGGGYKSKPSKLLELCKLNRELNITLMNTKVTLDSLADLANHDHFDVVLAFLVIHQMAWQKHSLYTTYLDEAKNYIENLLRLGNYLIIETSTDVNPEIDVYVEDLCLKLGGVYLGELPRYKTKNHNISKGRFFLFTAESFESCVEMISDHSFEKLNGVFK